MVDADDLELHTQLLGALPLINHFLDRLGLAQLLDAYLPYDDPRLALAPALAIGVVVRNLIAHREPLYALGEWASAFDPTVVGLTSAEVACLNDDRVGRTLDRLFDADRAPCSPPSHCAPSPSSASSSASFTTTRPPSPSAATTDRPRARPGAASRSWPSPSGTPRTIAPTSASWCGSSLSRPMAPCPSPTGWPTATPRTTPPTSPHGRAWWPWFGRADFLYVSDCKLASREAMDHIASRNGRFLTVLPRSRREDAGFRDWITTHTPPWAEVARRPGRRKADPDDVWWATPAPSPSEEGYRIVWVRSSSKRDRDAQVRAERIRAASPLWRPWPPSWRGHVAG